VSKGEEFDPDSLLGEEEPDFPEEHKAPASDEADPNAFSDENDGGGEQVEDEQSYSLDRIIPPAESRPSQPLAGAQAAQTGSGKADAKSEEKSVPRPIQTPAEPKAVTTPQKEEEPEARPAAKGARLKTLFEQVLEGQPPERAQKFHELKNVMGLREDDALWGVIAIMDIHLKLFEEIPRSISDASISATEAAKAQAIQEIQAALGRESEKMSHAVAVGLEARSASLFIEHLTWYGAIVLLYSAFVFSVGYAAGGNIVPPWMRDGMLSGLMHAPLGPVAGSTLVASSIFLILRALTEESGDSKIGKAKHALKLLGGIAVAGLGVFMI
jgi:hypothetical protein